MTDFKERKDKINKMKLLLEETKQDAIALQNKIEKERIMMIEEMEVGDNYLLGDKEVTVGWKGMHGFRGCEQLVQVKWGEHMSHTTYPEMLMTPEESSNLSLSIPQITCSSKPDIGDLIEEKINKKKGKRKKK